MNLFTANKSDFNSSIRESLVNGPVSNKRTMTNAQKSHYIAIIILGIWLLLTATPHYTLYLYYWATKLEFIADHSRLHFTIQAIFSAFFNSNHCINIVIYLIFHKDFRTTFFRALCDLFNLNPFVRINVEYLFAESKTIINQINNNNNTNQNPNDAFSVFNSNSKIVKNSFHNASSVFNSKGSVYRGSLSPNERRTKSFYIPNYGDRSPSKEKVNNHDAKAKLDVDAKDYKRPLSCEENLIDSSTICIKNRNNSDDSIRDKRIFIKKSFIKKGTRKRKERANKKNSSKRKVRKQQGDEDEENTGIECSVML
jgi:hypothetical protein